MPILALGPQSCSGLLRLLIPFSFSFSGNVFLMYWRSIWIVVEIINVLCKNIRSQTCQCDGTSMLQLC